jgi:hypothetical protein
MSLTFERAGTRSEPRTVELVKAELGPFAVVGGERIAQFHIGASLLLLLMCLLTSFLEARICARRGFGGGAFASTFFIRCVALTAGKIASPVLGLLTVLGLLFPWLTVALPKPKALVASAQDFLTANVKLRSSLWQSRHQHDRLSIIEIVVLAAGIGLFATMLWSGSSFRWSIFEERDFLNARRVLSELSIPLYGPELLLGGQTIGGGLYLLLAPVLALWNDPQGLLLFNRLLFLGTALILWWGIRPWAGPTGALFAFFTVIASERMVALSYWPIHPNFSLFFAFLYVCAALRGAVDGRTGQLLFSGLLLGFLTQLHFNYYLLLPCHVLLVLFGNGPRDRWMKTAAIAAVFVPIAPFIVIDALQGFPNIGQIAQRPRWHGLFPTGRSATLASSR